jgi:hypothetical protein
LLFLADATGYATSIVSMLYESSIETSDEPLVLTTDNPLALTPDGQGVDVCGIN